MTKTLDAAVWAWFLPRARVHDIYGSWRDLSPQEAKHLRRCGIDIGRSGAIINLALDEVDNTLDDTHTRAAAIGPYAWICNCGRYGNHRGEKESLEIGIPAGYSMTEMIAEVMMEVER